MYLEPGSTLQGGKYEIVKTLGQGGFGITYAAQHRLFDRKVAIKQFFMKDASDALADKFKAKFLKEARILANLEHPNIVRVTDVFEENGTAFYVMDFLPGGSLLDKIKKEGPVSEETAECYVRQVAAALDYIHGMNMVHLDVKPANILLNAKGNAVLIDFGISKHYDSAGEQTSNTPIGMSKGYAPLEQGMDGDVSQFKPSTDIYSLGATLYHLLTGFPPPEASVVNEDGLQQPDLIGNRPWRAIYRAMQPRRKDRPQSIPEFLSLLEDVEEDEGTVILNAPRPQISAPLAPPVQEEAQSSVPMQQPARSSRKGLVVGLAGGFVAAALVVGFLLLPEKKTQENVQAQQEDAFKVEETVSSQTHEETKTVQPREPQAKTKVKETTSAQAGTNTKNETVGKSDKAVETAKALVSAPASAPAPSAATESASVLEPVSSSEPEPVAIPTRGTSGGHEWLDMGLSVKWASCNVGASAPSDPGSYFAWGEVVPKQDFNKGNYSVPSSKMKLSMADDPAAKSWGKGWRMPTPAEVKELMEKCTWTWTSQNGVNGYKVVSKVTGNSLFLPATGQYSGSMLVFESEFGYYWTSSSDYAKTAVTLYFSSGQIHEGAEVRESGSPVRAVYSL